MPILGFSRGGAPSGTIAIWMGIELTIPSGWKKCDGTLGTPNLTNRFPRCVPTVSTNPGSVGGTETETLTISQIPSHIHALNVSDHDHKHHTESEASVGTLIAGPLSQTGTIVGPFEFEIDVSTTALVTSIGLQGGSNPHNNIPLCKNGLYIQKV